MFSFPYLTWVLVLVAGVVLLIGYRLLLRLSGVVLVPDNGVGIVTRRFSLAKSHSTLPDGALIALRGEAGIQADTLAPGLHFGLWPWQYTVALVPFVTVPEGKIGIVDVSAMIEDADAGAPVVTTGRAKTARAAATGRTVAVAPTSGG